MLVKCYGSAITGIDAMTVAVEVSATPGVEYVLVGLPDSAVRESLSRITSAFEHNGFRKPGKRIVVNLSPADIRKEGAAYDLPIAVGILAASSQLVSDRLEKTMMMAELSLDGSLLPVRGALPMAVRAREEGFGSIILPEANAREAAVVSHLDVYGMGHLKQVVDFLSGKESPDPIRCNTREDYFSRINRYDMDFSDVRGQGHVKRAMEIAAAGGHNLLMVGPPGSGKTMIARRLPTIVPPMTLSEALETTKIHSVAGTAGSGGGLMAVRPFRSPHHTASPVSIVGGGVHPRPGEISLAHNGILFMDELAEFPRNVLEVLRQPLEDREITVTRAGYSVRYPSNFMLVASMNPCPCGYFNHPQRACTCGPGTISRYMGRISGPLMDRIDMHVEVTPVESGKLSSATHEEDSGTIRERVVRAREIQNRRFREERIHTNAMMEAMHIRKYCDLAPEPSRILDDAMNRMGLSARAYHRIIKLSRTIADLSGSEVIRSEDVAEAVQYRSLDRAMWGIT